MRIITIGLKDDGLDVSDEDWAALMKWCEDHHVELRFSKLAGHDKGTARADPGVRAGRGEDSPDVGGSDILPIRDP